MPMGLCAPQAYLALASFLLMAGPSTGNAQQVTVFTGGTSYRFSDIGEHKTWVVGASGALVVGKYLRVDLGATSFGYSHRVPVEGYTISRFHLLPEVGIYLQAQSGRFRPYVGVGAGLDFVKTDGWFRADDGTLHAALGADATVIGSWGPRVEVRFRGIVPLGETRELTVGLTRRL